MKKWQLLGNIIMEILVFFGTAILLIFCVPKLLGFFWPFVASWILALFARPLCVYLEKHIRLNKKWASAIIIVLVLTFLAWLGYLIGTKLGKEIISLLSGAPEYYSYLKHTIKELGDTVNNIVSPVSADMGKQVTSFFNNLIAQMGLAVNKFAPQGVKFMGEAASNITSGFIGVVVMILSAFFFITEKDRLTMCAVKIIPEDIRNTVVNIKDKLMAALGGFVMAQFKIMGIIFVILLVGFLILGNPYALLLALLICVVDLLPVLGTGTILIPWTVICFLQGDYRQAGFILVLYLICLVARQFLQPKIIGDSVGMDSMTTLVLIYTGYKLDGIKGMLIALLGGVVVLTLYKLGLFDRKIARLNHLLYEYRHFDDESMKK